MKQQGFRHPEEKEEAMHHYQVEAFTSGGNGCGRHRLETRQRAAEVVESLLAASEKVRVCEVRIYDSWQGCWVLLTRVSRGEGR